MNARELLARQIADRILTNMAAHSAGGLTAAECVIRNSALWQDAGRANLTREVARNVQAPRADRNPQHETDR